jgi:hypothetical protein
MDKCDSCGYKNKTDRDKCPECGDDTWVEIKSKKKTTKKVVAKKPTKVDVVADAIKQYKKDNPDWKKQSQDDLYAIESYIDGLLYEKKYNSYGYVSARSTKVHIDAEVILERLTFEAIKKMQKGKRHTCDQYYDDAFDGYDEKQ